MYSDPKHIRNKRLNLSLNEIEQRLIDAHAEFNGMQPAVFARELVLEALQKWEAEQKAKDAQGTKAANS